MRHARCKTRLTRPAASGQPEVLEAGQHWARFERWGFEQSGALNLKFINQPGAIIGAATRRLWVETRPTRVGAPFVTSAVMKLERRAGPASVRTRGRWRGRAPCATRPAAQPDCGRLECAGRVEWGARVVPLRSRMARPAPSGCGRVIKRAPVERVDVRCHKHNGRWERAPLVCIQFHLFPFRPAK